MYDIFFLNNAGQIRAPHFFLNIDIIKWYCLSSDIFLSEIAFKLHRADQKESTFSLKNCRTSSTVCSKWPNEHHVDLIKIEFLLKILFYVMFYIMNRIFVFTTTFPIKFISITHIFHHIQICLFNIHKKNERFHPAKISDCDCY